ncbi:MAG: vitamin B12-dependent ribonucleotide reductase, partial [Candidatus Latescibacteria bacterium]|nr:vitamin B12-dependent ribonucleotide reductase [Candidatus Latescibacterota bacterium]
FRMDDAEVPETWSQLATDIVVSKYFRKRGVPRTGHEISAREVVHRVAHTIRQAGEDQGGYFDTRQDADTFEAELAHHMIHQMGAFNSPVWFNCGLYHEYGIKGREGHWHWDRKRDRVVEAKDSYSHPQCSACYIQSVDDDLESIFDLIKNEARLFKYGSGTGTNFSKIRGSMERLSGGGTSSGLMSFLEVFDKGAGATKSGGTTRRAAKMVCLDMDHPEIVDFVTWKAREEKKVSALIAGGYSSDFNGDAYRTVGGQNSNNSVRIPDAFIEAYEADGEWVTHLRTTGEVHETHRARDLMGMIGEATWCCADPGVQFDTTINKWHTCPNTDKIHGSNPCSEYMFLDDSACNLSSINLMAFLDDENTFDIEGFRHACKIFFLAQEILISFASYPTQLIAQNSHDYRPLGLGYANLGTLLMVLGLPYDSPEGRAICGAITAIMCGQAYATSALMAKDKGPFSGYGTNREPMLEVIRMHRDAVDEIDPAVCPSDLLESARTAWDQALALGEKHGFRNAQATVIAPTGTIGLLMDCDTTGIEPDFALVKFKKLAGGGYFKIVNAAVPRALARLGYEDGKIADILTHVSGTLTLDGAPHVNRESLLLKGLTQADLEAAEKALPGVFELPQAFSPWTLGGETMQRLGYSQDDCAAPDFCLLASLGFTPSEIEQANEVICGRMTVEGAPHLEDRHLAVFDCANRCGKHGTRFISPSAHLTMMAAAQGFISGAISKTVNVPTETTAEEIENLFLDGWRMGIKAVAIYRDGSKQSQPLSTSSSDAEDTETEDTASEPAEVPSAAPVPAAEVSSEPQDKATIQAVKRDLPQKRMGFTQEARVAGHKVFLRTGEYEDGSLGEIFIDMHKEGAPFRSMLNCFAIAVSKGLQHGVPL